MWGEFGAFFAGKDAPMARAIAVGLAHPFGVGNAHYRIGAAAPRWVDTVPFGCYRREVFTRNGLFDEDHVRTEDDEFNLRLRKNGGRSLLVPEIVIDYYARESLSKIWRMYYYYGYFKPLVARKLGLVLGLRHIMPSLLIMHPGRYLAFGLVVSYPGSAGLPGPGQLIFWQMLYCAWMAGRGQGLRVCRLSDPGFPDPSLQLWSGISKGVF